ncbi:MAG TPA: sigma-70 family RNA polymerase sigma factor [Candidatus Hydrogenedentes bacterium]|nr:sigma-70 family RNA polymerase sigma factor [Candidatus Hydrogenedentota bacterium]
MNESELVTRILAGEESLFAQIVSRYSGCVWAVCSSYVRNPSECEDVAQEVFVQGYRRLDTLRNPRALGAWLCQLARRRSLMWLRGATRREQSLARYGETLPPPAPDSGSGARGELEEAVWDALHGLPELHREALLLRYAEGYSTEQAAAALGISAAALRKRTERAKNLLRDALWERLSPALAKRRHSGDLEKGILAAIPFGTAPWLGATGTGGAAVSATSMKGGTSAMFGKITLMAGAIALTLLGGNAALQFVSAPEAATPQTRAMHAHQTDQADAAPAASKAPEPADAVAAPPSPEAAPGVTPAAETASPAPAVAREIHAAPAHVSGRITDGDGNPLANADVFLEVGRGLDRNDVCGHYPARTGQDGRYQIAGVGDFGPGVLYAVADGHCMGFQVCDPSEGGSLRGVDVELSPAVHFVAGRVVDEDGMPVPGASVECLYYGYDLEGLAETAKTGVTTGHIGGVKLVFSATDDNGMFRVALPRGGLCDFRVVCEGYGTGFFPKVPTGEENAVFTLNPGGVLSGTVTDAEGRPVPNVPVRIAGEVRPGGLSLVLAKIQPLSAPPVTVTTGDDGGYRAEGLGADFSYSVEALPPEQEDTGALPTEQGVRRIAEMMRQHDRSMNVEEVSDGKKGLRVRAGRETAGADLVLGETSFATLRGRVTDRATGRPACPVVVTAAVYGDGARDYFQAKRGCSAVTLPDGRYELRLPNLTAPVEFSVGHLYMTEGGSAWDQPEEELATVTLGPGETRELDLAVDAPVTAPVRYVGADGKPRQGMEAAVRMAGAQGGCGGMLVSGADGRVVFHGLRPGVELQALAWLGTGSRTDTVGMSGAFTGEPGETVPELTVVCRLSGGVEGLLTYPDGRPAAHMALLCGAEGGNGETVAAEAAGPSDASGYFQLSPGLPEGVYPAIVVGFLDRQTATPYSATVENVEITAGAVTDLGTLVLAPERNLARVVAALGWDHTSNTAIARNYTPEALGTLTNPDAVLKTGLALYDLERYEEALGVFGLLEEETQDAPLLRASALIWQGYLLDLLGRREEALAAYDAAADTGATGVMSHDQFGISYDPAQEAEARRTAPFVRVENLER